MSQSRPISSLGTSGRSTMNCEKALSLFEEKLQMCSRSRRSQRSYGRF